MDSEYLECEHVQIGHVVHVVIRQFCLEMEGTVIIKIEEMFKEEML